MKYRLLEGEDEFLDMVEADPEDEMARHIYADWLESMGDLRAEWLRLECEFHPIARKPFHHRYRPLRKQLRAILPRIEPEWGLLVTRDPAAVAHPSMWGPAAEPPPHAGGGADPGPGPNGDDPPSGSPSQSPGLLGRIRGLFRRR